MTTDNKQSVLSGDEVENLLIQYNSGRTPPSANFLAAFEQAVLSKLRGAGEPVAWINQTCIVRDGEFAGHNAPEVAFTRYGDFKKSIPLYAAPQASAEYPQAAEVCAELYQVIGSLADDLGVFGHPQIVKALDNASQHAMVHDDVLPFPSFDRQQRGGDVGSREARKTPHGLVISDDPVSAIECCITDYENETPYAVNNAILSGLRKARAALTVQPRPVVVGSVTVNGKGRSSVDLDTSHVDLPEGDYELVVRAAIAQQGKEG